MTDFEEAPQTAGIGWIANHLPTILWDRRLYVLASFLVCLAVATIAAFVLPTEYRSTATLLVEPQDLPQNVAQDPDGGAIGERIAKIREKVLSRGDLIALIEQNDLYAGQRKKQPMSEIVDKMRKDTSVSALANDIGKTSASDVIAINMSFDYPDAGKARDVMQSFVSSFLRIDSDSVEDQASLAVRFLQDQALKLQAQIRTIENQITTLKARNGAALSGVSTTPYLDTGSYSAQIVALEMQNRDLLRDARKAPQRDVQIVAAEAALAAARSQFSDRHPDVIAARERLEAFRQVVPSTVDPGSAAIAAQIRENNAAISSLRAAKNGALASASAAMSGQARAPAILEAASQLENRATSLRDQLKSVSDDLLKAQNSLRMASEQRGARLSLVEPPNLPDYPQWPNRPLIIGGGALLGLLVGLVLALAVEFIVRPLRSPAQIEALNVPVLGIVPNFVLGSRRDRWTPFQKSWNPFKRRELGVG